MIRSFIAPLLLMVALVACTDNAIVHQSVELDPNGWRAEEKAVIEFEIENTDQAVDMYIGLRHTGDYPYRNLYLFTELRLPSGATERDTLELLLADRLGHWRGSGNGFVFANDIEHDILFSMNNRFPESGTYKMTFEQAMRVEELPGVLDIGLTIRPNVK